MATTGPVGEPVGEPPRGSMEIAKVAFAFARGLNSGGIGMVAGLLGSISPIGRGFPSSGISQSSAARAVGIEKSASGAT